METSNNAEFIYQYTSNVYEEVKKSIDIITDKLTKVLAFSGILLKFGYDMDSTGFLFSAKLLILTLLTITIGLCATGLWPKDSGRAGLTPEYLIEEHYGLDPESMRLMVSRARVEGISELRKLHRYRESILNYAIGCLAFCGLVFGMTGIISSIH